MSERLSRERLTGVPMTDSGEVLVVLTTFPDESSAHLCAEQLVNEHVVACAQVAETTVRSFYYWEGQLRREREVAVWLKTSASRWNVLQTRLTDLHPYDVPELIALDARASQAYGAWLHRGAREPSEEDV